MWNFRKSRRRRRRSRRRSDERKRRWRWRTTTRVTTGTTTSAASTTSSSRARPPHDSRRRPARPAPCLVCVTSWNANSVYDAPPLKSSRIFTKMLLLLLFYAQAPRGEKPAGAVDVAPAKKVVRPTATNLDDYDDSLTDISDQGDAGAHRRRLLKIAPSLCTILRTSFIFSVVLAVVWALVALTCPATLTTPVLGLLRRKVRTSTCTLHVVSAVLVLALYIYTYRPCMYTSTLYDLTFRTCFLQYTYLYLLSFLL